MEKVWYLDVDFKTPSNVAEIIERIWEKMEYGNDCYIHHMSIKNEEQFGDPIKNAALLAYLREQGVGEDELVLLHYAW